MKILVTGGAGYIGSHVVNLLGKDGAGHDVVVVDDLSTGHSKYVHGAKLKVLDIGNVDKLQKLFSHENFEAVFHFAGSIIIPESIGCPLKYYENNTKNSLELIRLCHEFGVHKFIFSSTAAVYGNPPEGIASEELPTIPINPYGRTKLAVEWILQDISRASDFNFIALRYFNVAGANVNGKTGQSNPNSTHLIKAVSQLVTGKRTDINIFGDDYNTPDGTCIRDYLHVDDLAQAHVDALTFLDKGGQSEILNCGYGEGHSVKDVLSMAEKIYRTKLRTRVVSRRAGDIPILLSNVEKIRRVINWTPRYNDLEFIIRTAVEWEKKL